MSHFYRAQAWIGILDLDNVLQLSGMAGHTRTIKALLQAGANLHALDDEALRTAAWWGRSDAVKALLEGGANVHAKNDEALRWAEEQKHMDTAKVLRDWAAHGTPGVPSVPKP